MTSFGTLLKSEFKSRRKFAKSKPRLEPVLKPVLRAMKRYENHPTEAAHQRCPYKKVL